MHSTELHRDALPNLLFDAVEFGFLARQSNCGSDAVRKFRHRLCALGHAKPSNDTRRLMVKVPVPGSSCEIEAALFIGSAGEGGLIIQGKSAIRINPMRMLRHSMDGGQAGPVGLDGNDNVIGATVERASELLEQQLGLVAAAVDALAEAINAALPDEAECESEAFWVRSAEVCVDLPCHAASTIVRLMQRAALTGANQTTFDLYRVSAEDASGVPVVRWWRTENGPCFKFYAKGTEVARAEVGFDRSALCRTLEEPSKLHLDGCLAVRLLLEVADAGAPLLGELVAHVETGRRQGGSEIELRRHLYPLMRLADGRRGGKGRPPGEGSFSGALEALEALLSAGVCRATKAAGTSALRRVLDDLVRAGVLARSGRTASYTLKATWARAAERITASMLD